MVPALFISEVVEGSSTRKAVEIFNGGTTAVDLTDVEIATLSNGAVTSSGALNLTGMLAPGAVFTICSAQADMVYMLACDEINASVTNFNGDDTIMLFIESGVSAGFDAIEDTPIDAFGEVGVRPMNSPYENKGYARCDFTRFDGLSAFTAGRYTEQTMLDDFSGIGVAPTVMNGTPVSSCPGSMP